jgi:hypothetical protein
MGRFAATPERSVRIACDLRAEPIAGGHSLLSTETRITALDAHARRWFGRYWRLVGPCSALIRRRWLRAAAGSAAVPGR